MAIRTALSPSLVLFHPSQRTSLTIASIIRDDFPDDNGHILWLVLLENLSEGTDIRIRQQV